MECCASSSRGNAIVSDILAIHDLSSYGKSSLTVVMPVLEALGSECSPLPTALLSTQTDGFDELYVVDFTKDMEEIERVHESLNLKFDGIYSGYLGSNEQISIVERLIKHYNAFALVDPVLGDGGELYQTMDESSVSNMRKLIKHASLITPNYTEALLLTEREYVPRLDNKAIKELVDALKAIGPEEGVITSVPIAMGICNVGYDKDEIRLFPFEELDASFPGSGDLFASLLISLIMKKLSFFSSIKIATEISSYAILESKRQGRERRRGIMLSPVFKEIKRRAL